MPTEVSVEDRSPVVVVEDQVQEIVTVEVPIPGAQGDPGIPGSAASGYIHTQNTPSLVWTVQHNLALFPGGIYVEDDNGDEQEGIVHHINVQVLTITFFEAVRGTAYIS